MPKSTAKKTISNNKIMTKLLKIEKEMKEFREVKKQIDRIIIGFDTDSDSESDSDSDSESESESDSDSDSESD